MCHSNDQRWADNLAVRQIQKENVDNYVNIFTLILIDLVWLSHHAP